MIKEPKKVNRGFKSVSNHAEQTLLDYGGTLSRFEVINLLGVINSYYLDPDEINRIGGIYNNYINNIRTQYDTYCGGKNIPKLCKNFTDYYIDPVVKTRYEPEVKILLWFIDNRGMLPYMPEFIACVLGFKYERCTALRKFFNIPFVDKEKELKEEIKMLRNDIEKRSKQIEALYEECDDFKHRNEILRDKVQGFLKTIAIMKETEKNIERRLSYKDKRIKMLEEDIRLLRTELKKANSTIKLKDAEIDRMAKRNRNIELRYNKYQSLVSNSEAGRKTPKNRSIVWMYGYSQCEFTDSKLNIVSVADAYENFNAYRTLSGIEDSISIEEFTKQFISEFKWFGLEMFIYAGDGNVYFSHIRMKKSNNSFIINDGNQATKRSRKKKVEV